MPDLAAVIVSAGVAFALALATLYFATRSGLSVISDKLISQLKDRVALLETERTEDKARILDLERENAELRKRVERLERALADRAIDHAGD